MTLEIYLLGQFKLKHDDQVIELPSRPAQSLLAYLALNAGATLRREKLASLLWAEASETNARGYLRQALWRTRKSLESGSLAWEDYLRISELSVTFERQSDYWLDVEQILRAAEGRTLDELVEEVKLYRGELLPGFYEGWVELERDRLQTAYFQKMNTLLEGLIQARRWDEVLRWGEEWILHGYSPEPAYRGLMKAYAGMSNPGMVTATYQRCVEALRRDLEVEPSSETRRLYEQFQAGEMEEYGSPVTVVFESSEQPGFLQDSYAALPFEKPLVVARERELGRFYDHLNLAIKGQGGVIFVTGEAGSGKTSLLAEFSRRAQDSHPDLIVASGNCNAHTGIGDPYLPFREILDLLSGDVRARWSAGAITKEYAQFLWDLIPVTAQALVEVGPDLIDTFVTGNALIERAATYAPGEAEWLTLLDRLVKRKQAEAAVLSLHQGDLFIQYSKLLKALSVRSPLVLVLDDLQWADLGSISLLFHLGRHLAGSRILILGAYRPEEVASGRAGDRHPLEQVVNELRRELGDIEVNLDALQARVFVDALLDSELNQLSRQFRELLFGLTHGHPLFTVELLRGMQERGDLVQNDHGYWVEGPSLDWETLPARIEAVIAERIGRLDPSVQTTLRVASVEGEVFTAEVVARVQGLKESNILSCLSTELDRVHRLVRAQSIQRTGGQLLSSYRFRHILVQKYLYHSLDEIERVHLHEQVGKTLEELFENQPGAAALAPQLARHFQEARLNAKSIQYLLKAGERALQMSAYQEAVTDLNQGLALLETLPDPQVYAEQELSLWLAYSIAVHLATGFIPEEMERALDRALELCQEIENVTQYCQTLSGLWIIHYVQGNYPEACELAVKVLQQGQQAEDQILIILGHWCLGITLFVLGEFQESRASLEQIKSFYDLGQHHRLILFLRGVDTGLSAMAYLACCLWMLGYPDQAKRQSQEVLALAHKINHSFTLADVLSYAGCEFSKIVGDGQALKQHAEELIQIAHDKNFASWLAGGKSSLGEALILLGKHQEGIALAWEGVNENLSSKVRVYTARTLLSLAVGYLKQGDLERGNSMLDQAFETMEQTGERYLVSEAHRVLAAFQIQRSDEAAAEASLQKALEVARRQGARGLELRAAIDLARLWQKQGRQEDGRQLVEQVYAGFTEGVDTPDLRQARSLLNDLA